MRSHEVQSVPGLVINSKWRWFGTKMWSTNANVQPKISNEKSQSRLPGELSNRTSDHRQPNHFRVAFDNYLSHDNYFHFSNCANSTFASVSCRGLVTFREPWNGLLCAHWHRPVSSFGQGLKRNEHGGQNEHEDLNSELALKCCRTSSKFCKPNRRHWTFI